MDSPRAQPPPLDQKPPRAREDKSILTWDETSRTPPLASQTMYPVADPREHLTDWQHQQDGMPRSGNLIKRAQTWVGNAYAIYRSKPWSMYLFLVTGILFAVAHHLFYLHLQGKEAKNQSLMLRYGTVIAFCAKASLSSAVVVAFQQRAWMAVRRKTVPIGEMDSIFSANRDFVSLLDWTAVRKAKVAACLAIYVWVTPLIVVLTSETLFAVARSREEEARCFSVRTLNFTNLETVNSRDESAEVVSLSTWNTTSLDDIGTDADFGPDAFDYYHGPDMHVRLVTDRAVNLRQAVVRKATAPEVCASGWNCSYVLNFTAPGYKCEELASGAGSNVKKLGDSEAPFGTEHLAPLGNYTYYAKTNMGDYGTEQIESTADGEPKKKPPYPTNLGAFRTEPIIWIGYANVTDASKKQPTNSTEPGWHDAYTPVIFGCEHYEVNYTVLFNYTGGAQTHEIMHREYLTRVIDTTFLPDERDADKALTDRTKADPEENYVYPQDVENYRRVAAYHSIGKAFRSYLEGFIQLPDISIHTNLMSTGLVTQPNSLPVGNFQERIQKMYEDIVVSLLSEPKFVIVSWASNGTSSGTSRGGPSTSYPCIRQRLMTVFAYNKTQLLAVYAASVALASVGVLLGLQAVREEGVVRDMKPSSIIEGNKASSIHELLLTSKPDSSNPGIEYGVVQQPGGGGSRT